MTQQWRHDTPHGHYRRNRRLAIERCEDRVVLSAGNVAPVSLSDVEFLFNAADSYALFDSTGNRVGIIHYNLDGDQIVGAGSFSFTADVVPSSGDWRGGGGSRGGQVVELSGVSNIYRIPIPEQIAGAEHGWIALPIVDPSKTVALTQPAVAAQTESLDVTTEAAEMEATRSPGLQPDVGRPRSTAAFFDVAAVHHVADGESVALLVHGPDARSQPAIERGEQSARSAVPLPVGEHPEARELAAEALPREQIVDAAWASDLSDDVSVESRLPAAEQAAKVTDDSPATAANVLPIDRAYADWQSAGELAVAIERHQPQHPEVFAIALAALVAAEHHLSQRTVQQPDRREEIRFRD